MMIRVNKKVNKNDWILLYPTKPQPQISWFLYIYIKEVVK